MAQQTTILKPIINTDYMDYFTVGKKPGELKNYDEFSKAVVERQFVKKKVEEILKVREDAISNLDREIIPANDNLKNVGDAIDNKIRNYINKNYDKLPIRKNSEGLEVLTLDGIEIELSHKINYKIKTKKGK